MPRSFDLVKHIEIEGSGIRVQVRHVARKKGAGCRAGVGDLRVDDDGRAPACLRAAVKDEAEGRRETDVGGCTVSLVAEGMRSAVGCRDGADIDVDVVVGGGERRTTAATLGGRLPLRRARGVTISAPSRHGVPGTRPPAGRQPTPRMAQSSSCQRPATLCSGIRDAAVTVAPAHRGRLGSQPR